MIRSAIINVMTGAARKASRDLQRDFGEVENLQVSRKGPADFVSAADRKAEKTLHEELKKARPGYGFMLEEAGIIPGPDKTHTWIVDPLDGTTNFIHSIPLFAISIALQREGEIVAGIVYNPISDELFSAEKGKGAYLNDKRMRVAARQNLGESVLSCGIPHMERGDTEVFARELNSVQSQVAGIRRTGSAALDLAWLAAGRFDGFWERGLQPWDIAAGILLVRESGGMVGDLDSRADVLTTGNILASNTDLFTPLERILRKAHKPATD